MVLINFITRTKPLSLLQIDLVGWSPKQEGISIKIKQKELGLFLVTTNEKGGWEGNILLSSGPRRKRAKEQKQSKPLEL